MKIPFYKFPSTPHIFPRTTFMTRDDKILTASDLQLIISHPVVVEEKIDGANLGISFDADGVPWFQNRGEYLQEPFLRQWKYLPAWFRNHENALFDLLQDRYILFGEWCYAKHSIFYDSLPDWFLAFDIYDVSGKYFLSTKKRNELAKKAEVKVVPQLYFGKLDMSNLGKYVGQSTFGSSTCEGVYVRYENDEQLIVRTKYVGEDFFQEISDHWSKKTLVPNMLAR